MECPHRVGRSSCYTMRCSRCALPPLAHWSAHPNRACPARCASTLGCLQSPQAFVNITALAVPLALCAFDHSTTIAPLEAFGWCGWLISWTLESIADCDKLLFSRVCTEHAWISTAHGAAALAQ